MILCRVFKIQLNANSQMYTAAIYRAEVEFFLDEKLFRRAEITFCPLEYRRIRLKRIVFFHTEQHKVNNT